MSGHWLIYVRRSYKKLGTDRVAASADTSDEMQLERCLALMPAGATYDVISDSGGHHSGRSEKRRGWAEVVERVMTGGIAGVAAYDVSRLARKTRLILNLKDEMQKRGVQLRIATMPDMNWDSAAGEMVLTQLAATSSMLAQMDSERMKDIMRSTFEAGGHRGNDPFGYQTARDEAARVVHPRTLEPVPEEAEIVRRVFRELAQRPFSKIADLLNAEGVPHRTVRAWTKNAVKDLWRRREVYRGNVTSKRGLEVIAGNHPAILTPEEFRDAAAGVDRRLHRRGVREPTAKRFYLLGGLVFCSCGTKMHGTAQTNRGMEWLYYVCPVAEKRRAVLDADGTSWPVMPGASGQPTLTASSSTPSGSSSFPTTRSGRSAPSCSAAARLSARATSIAKGSGSRARSSAWVSGSIGATLRHRNIVRRCQTSAGSLPPCPPRTTSSSCSIDTGPRSVRSRTRWTRPPPRRSGSLSPCSWTAWRRPIVRSAG